MFNRKHAVSLGILFVASFCVLTQAQATVDRPKPGVNPKLAAHQEKFLPARVEKVRDRIYFAIGYDLGNMVFVEGDDSVIVIDTLWMVENAAKARDDFVKLCDKPIKTVIYTHSHAHCDQAHDRFPSDTLAQEHDGEYRNPDEHCAVDDAGFHRRERAERMIPQRERERGVDQRKPANDRPTL